MRTLGPILGALILGSVLVITSRGSMKPGPAASPEHAAMHFHLGRYQRLSGQPDKAVESLRRALACQPESYGARAELGTVLVRLGQRDEAAKQFEAALALRPDHAESHCGLANLLLAQSKAAEACEHYRQALQTEPDELSALNNLAWVLSTSNDTALRDGKTAILHAERAAGLTKHEQPFLLMTLAAAYAAGDRFPDAIATAETALHLAEGAGNEGLATMLKAQLTAYHNGTALR
jgi:tetratricopeptide (TPR) repeat protein